MPKYQVFILTNIAMLLGFYICGVVAGASFNIFDWSEGIRFSISISYGMVATIVNAMIATEYKSK